MLTVNNQAPDFTGINEVGEQVRLRDLLGKVVILYFYPRDNTSGCIKEACSFRDNLKDIQDCNAVVLGVSPDSVKKHQNFREKFELPFSLISDEEKDILSRYGVWAEKKMYGKTHMGVLRTTYIIDEKGMIEKIFEKVKAADHGAEVLAYLKSR